MNNSDRSYEVEAMGSKIVLILHVSSCHITSGYPLGYHDAIWHPRAHIQDIIKKYPHLNI